MRLSTVRIGIVACLGLFFLIFFLPLIPFSQTVTAACGTDSSGYSLCTVAGSYTGYQSVGLRLTGWGSFYSGWYDDGQNWGGYVVPSLTFDLGDGPGTLTPWGVLFEVFIPATIACALLLAPELRNNRISQVVLAGFGGSLYLLGMLMGATMLAYAYFRWAALETGLLYSLSGLLMVLYSARIWPFTQRQAVELVPSLPVAESNPSTSI